MSLHYLERPSRPTEVSVQTVEGTNNHQFNISWTATTVTGVNQTYIIVFEDFTNQIASTYYIITLKDLATSCDLFLAFVKAVNGAGESDPSNNVSIPSLPDIRPVTDSLTHQVQRVGVKIQAYITYNVSECILFVA